MRKLLVLIAGVGLVAGACASDGGSKARRPRRRPRRRPDGHRRGGGPGVGPEGAVGRVLAPRRRVPAGETKQTLTVDGAERWWFRHVPPAHDGSTPVPLVIDLHGYSEGAAIHEQTSGLGPFGDAARVRDRHAPGPGRGRALGHRRSAPPTSRSSGKVLDATEQQLCIDTNRVYVDRPAPTVRS